MSKTMIKQHKPFSEMTTRELAEATSEFDGEFVADTFGPPDPEATEAWDRAKPKCRPDEGKASKVISVSLETDLVERCDRLARKKGVTRAALISRGLRVVLAGEKSR